MLINFIIDFRPIQFHIDYENVNEFRLTFTLNSYTSFILRGILEIRIFLVSSRVWNVREPFWVNYWQKP